MPAPCGHRTDRHLAPFQTLSPVRRLLPPSGTWAGSSIRHLPRSTGSPRLRHRSRGPVPACSYGNALARPGQRPGVARNARRALSRPDFGSSAVRQRSIRLSRRLCRTARGNAGGPTGMLKRRASTMSRDLASTRTGRSRSARPGLRGPDEGISRHERPLSAGRCLFGAARRRRHRAHTAGRAPDVLHWPARGTGSSTLRAPAHRPRTRRCLCFIGFKRGYEAP